MIISHLFSLLIYKALVFGGKHRNLLACGSVIINVYLLKPVLYHTLIFLSYVFLEQYSSFIHAYTLGLENKEKLFDGMYSVQPIFFNRFLLLLLSLKTNTEHDFQKISTQCRFL